MELRPYQILSLDLIRNEFKKHKKVLLHSPTGSGKTVVFCEIIKNALKKNKKCLSVVRGRKLVRQISERLFRESVPHGVMMAGHHLYRPNEKVQACSIDTLNSRNIYPNVDLVIIDECHLGTSQSYINFCAQYPNAYFVSVTATPYCTKSLRHLADVIVSPISMQELIDQGYLVPGKYFAPSNPNLDHIKIDSSTKDYNQRELSDEMDKMKIVGNIVEEWKKYGESRPSVCFAVTVRHSEHIAEEFNKAGIPAVHCDANSPDLFRERTIERLRSGSIKVLSNVGLFGVGVDMPFLSCIILARPTQSLNLYLQQVGRGTRTFPGKSNCIYLDHAGNVLRHGFPADEREPTLDGKIKKLREISAKRCEECFAVVAKWPCEFCGYEPKEKAPRTVNQVEGTLSELTPTIQYPHAKPEEIRAKIAELDLKAKMYNFKAGWVWHNTKSLFGAEVARFYLGARFKKNG